MNDLRLPKENDSTTALSLKEKLRRATQPAGGWAYHRKHLFNAKHWREFRDELGLWLEAHIPPQEKLVLVGSSAGYNLADSFLFEFQQITSIEIDPLSPWFWSLNHKLPVKNWSQHNYLGDSKTINLHAFRNIRDAYPNEPLLFCNLLGQLGFLYEMNSKTAAQLKNELLALKKPWASFHDVFSLHGSPHELNRFASGFETPKDRDDLVKKLMTWQLKLEVKDHWTMEIIPESKEASYFLWRLTKNSIHIVEAVSNT